MRCERVRIAGTNGIDTIQGNVFDAIARPESFSRPYLNPPGEWPFQINKEVFHSSKFALKLLLPV